MKRSQEEPEHRFLGFAVTSYPSLLGRSRPAQPAEPAPGATAEGATAEDGPARNGPAQGGPVDDRALAHPVDYVRWRLEKRRQGPFVADFRQFRAGRAAGPGAGSGPGGAGDT